MKKFADRMLRRKYAVFGVFAAILIVSCILIPKIGVNYNLSDYLSDSTGTKIALEIMEEEFGLTGNVQVMLTGVTESEAKEFAERLSEIENVRNVTFDATGENYYKDGKALFIVMFDGDDYSENAGRVISDIKAAAEGYDVQLGGTAASKQEQKAAITKQIPLILAVCICIAYAILAFTTRSWLEPLLFLLTAGVAVFINLGTNVIFGSISYITNSIAAILQLALSMDYSIMLLHAYHKNRRALSDDMQAMSASVAECMKPVSASALTTMAGLLALLFMSFTIGFDIGMVLMKGILISAAVSFTLFPCVILPFSELLDKTRFRFKKRGERAKGAEGANRESGEISKTEEKGEKKGGTARPHCLARFAKRANLFVVPLAVALLICAAFVQRGNVYTFTDSGGTNSAIAEVFGSSGSVVLVYKNGEGADEKQQQFIDGLAAYRLKDGTPALTDYTAYSNTLLEEYDAERLASATDMPTEQARQLLALYRLYGDPELCLMTMGEFLDYACYLAESDSETRQAIGDDAARALQILYTVNDATNTENTAEEFYEKLTGGVMEGFADVSQSSVNTLYSMYYSSNGIETGTPVAGHLIVEYGVSNTTIALLMPSQHKSLQAMNAVYRTFSDGEKYTFVGAAEKLSALAEYMPSEEGSFSVGADLISGVYLKKMMSESGYESEPAVARDLLAFVEENMETHALIAGNMNESQRKKVSAALAAERLFVGKNYTRVLLTVNVPSDGEEAYAFAEFANALAEEVFGGDGHVAGEIMSTNDLKQSFAHDQVLINVFTIVSIFLIVLVIFRSLSVPVLLVAVIQGAIWIFLSVFALASSPVFFMSYIVTSCILMGATIDYGILTCSNYVALRRTKGKEEALSFAVSSAMPTILSSGSVLMCCGFVISLISTQNSIATVGLLLGVGTISSVVMILFALPSFLYLCDKIIMKTTLSSRKNK